MLAVTCWSASRPIWISWASETSESCRRPVAGLVAQAASRTPAISAAARRAGRVSERHGFTLGVAFQPWQGDALEELRSVGLGAQAEALAVEAVGASLPARERVGDGSAGTVACADAALLPRDRPRHRRLPIAQRVQWARGSRPHAVLPEKSRHNSKQDACQPRGAAVKWSRGKDLTSDSRAQTVGGCAGSGHRRCRVVRLGSVLGNRLRLILSAKTGDFLQPYATREAVEDGDRIDVELVGNAERAEHGRELLGIVVRPQDVRVGALAGDLLGVPVGLVGGGRSQAGGEYDALAGEHRDRGGDGEVRVAVRI